MASDQYDRVRTETKQTIDVEVETVEHVEYLCPLCGMAYDEEEMIEVAFSARSRFDTENFRAHNFDQVCRYCSESVWEYDGRPSASDVVRDETDQWGISEIIFAGGTGIVILSLLAICLYLFEKVIASMAQASLGGVLLATLGVFAIAWVVIEKGGLNPE